MPPPIRLHDSLLRPWEQARGALISELGSIAESIRTLQNGSPDPTTNHFQVHGSTGTQDDFVLTDDATVLLVTSASSTFNGFSNVWGGRQVVVLFSGSGTHKLVNQSATSTINFRITCESTNGLTFGTNGSALLVYDSANFTWRAFTLSHGAPITPTFSAGNYTAASGSWTVASGDVTKFTYAQTNKNVLLDFDLTTTTVSATPTDLRRVLPAGFTLTKGSYNACLANNNGTKALGIVWADPSSDLLKFYSSGAFGAWAAATDTTGLSGQICIEVD